TLRLLASVHRAVGGRGRAVSGRHSSPRARLLPRAVSGDGDAFAARAELRHLGPPLRVWVVEDVSGAAFRQAVDLPPFGQRQNLIIEKAAERLVGQLAPRLGRVFLKGHADDLPSDRIVPAKTGRDAVRDVVQIRT